jgi:hypothetical protein
MRSGGFALPAPAGEPCGDFQNFPSEWFSSAENPILPLPERAGGEAERLLRL